MLEKLDIHFHIQHIVQLYTNLKGVSFMRFDNWFG